MARFAPASDSMVRAISAGRHVVGDVPVLDEGAHEAEVGLRCGRKADLDLLEADLAEHPEHAELALRVHRLKEGLVAVAQVGAHPDRRPGEGLVRPCPVGEADGREGAVLAGGLHI